MLGCLEKEAKQSLGEVHTHPHTYKHSLHRNSRSYIHAYLHTYIQTKMCYTHTYTYVYWHDVSAFSFPDLVSDYGCPVFFLVAKFSTDSVDLCTHTLAQ